MKKLLIVLAIAFLPMSVLASPFMVCDPQAGITTYRLTGPAWVPASIAAQANGSLKLDVASSYVGLNSLTVQACVIDPVWGEVCSATVPFAFTRPIVPLTPTGIILQP